LKVKRLLSKKLRTIPATYPSALDIYKFRPSEVRINIIATVKAVFAKPTIIYFIKEESILTIRLMKKWAEIFSSPPWKYYKFYTSLV